MLLLAYTALPLLGFLNPGGERRRETMEIQEKAAPKIRIAYSYLLLGKITTVRRSDTCAHHVTGTDLIPILKLRNLVFK
jgi:hypothetical protein